VSLRNVSFPFADHPCSGVSVEGSVIVERSDCNAKAYGANVSAKQLRESDATTRCPPLLLKNLADMT
jgi:lipid-binding SYLF domain-containing protein